MHRLVLIVMMAAPLCACATRTGAPAASSVAAVVEDESQRQKAAKAAQSGETSSEALAHVADGPKTEIAPPR